MNFRANRTHSRIAGLREIIIGGDFNLTVSNWAGSERPVSKQDLAIQARLTDLRPWSDSDVNALRIARLVPA